MVTSQGKSGNAQTPPQAAQPVNQPPPELTITVFVTSMDGQPLPEVWVRASGPVNREGATDPSGTVTFSNVTAGVYRLRFEHDNFVTLERDVVVVPESH